MTRYRKARIPGKRLGGVVGGRARGRAGPV